MSKSLCLVLTLLCLLAAAPMVALAQQQEPPIFTFVAEWDVPRAQWGDYTAFGEKNARPVQDRLAADGTLMNWGNYATTVHEEKGITHGVWYTAHSVAGIEKALGEFLKLPPNPAVFGARHQDYLLRSLIHRGRATSASSAYLWVSITVVQPGKGQQWREHWEKYSKPTYDELFSNGTISEYTVYVEHVHNHDPAMRYVVYVAPTADGVDKVRAAFAALEQKRSGEENRAIGAAFAEVTVPGTHRDYFARVSTYWHK